MKLKHNIFLYVFMIVLFLYFSNYGISKYDLDKIHYTKGICKISKEIRLLTKLMMAMIK